MSFLDVLDSLDYSKITSLIEQAKVDDVLSVLSQETLNYDDYLLLLSDAALEVIEELALKANDLTVRFFGKTILLYAPLYLCSECDNQCVYCGFSQERSERKICLSPEEVMTEADILYQKGFRHLLLVSGEKRNKISLGYLKGVACALHKKFDSVSLEIFPLEEDEYQELFLCGVDSLTIYQEVYDRQIYGMVHPSGAKADFNFRLQTPERAARAGFYRINIGALLGLGKWQHEAALLGLHADYLRKTFWRSQILVSFPRIKPSAANFEPPNPVSDRQLAQMICALRIFVPSLGLVLSTRERPELRDSLIPLGITQMSAESKTSPGGYSSKAEAEVQFEVSDRRSVAEVVEAIRQKNYEPVFKDWDKAFI